MTYIDEFVLALEDLLAELGVKASGRNKVIKLGKETVLASYKNGLEAGTRRAKSATTWRKRDAKPTATRYAGTDSHIRSNGCEGTSEWFSRPLSLPGASILVSQKTPHLPTRTGRRFLSD